MPVIQQTPVGPSTTTIISPTTTKLPVQINIKNTSNFAGNLTGFTIMHKDAAGNQHALSQTISNTKFKIYPASAKKILPVEFNLKASSGTFFIGTSAIFINGQQISTLYKNQPWNRAITDAIYVTSKDGTTWTLDIKAMNNAYQKLSKPNESAPKSTSKKITSITKDLTVSLIEHEQKKPLEKVMQTVPKISQAAKASEKAVATTSVTKPTMQ